MTIDDVWERLNRDSYEYANERDGAPKNRIEEVAMAWRDGYRTAIGDLIKDPAIVAIGCKRGEEK